MSKIKFGAIVVDGRGKIGGHVMTKNRQGSALRTKVTPTNRKTNTQQGSKNRLANLSDNWRALTDAQRQAWDAAAQDVKKSNIFGDSYSPTGKNLYMIVNQNLVLAGSAAVSAPPAVTPATALTSLTVSDFASGALEFAFAPSPVPASHVLRVEATRPLSPGVNAAGSQFRFVKNIAASQTTPQDIATEYEAIFGTIPVGKRIFIRAYTINTTSGARSLPLQISEVTS